MNEFSKRVIGENVQVCVILCSIKIYEWEKYRKLSALSVLKCGISFHLPSKANASLFMQSARSWSITPLMLQE